MQTENNREQEPQQAQTSETGAAAEEERPREADGAAPEEKTGQAPERPRRASPLPAILAVLALLSAAGGIGAGYYAWQQSKAERRGLETRLAETGSALQSLQSRLQGLRGEVESVESRLSADLREELEGLREGLGQVRESVAQVRAEQQRGPAPVVEPARVEHLLQIANDTLILERDVGTALAALRLADRRLRELGDPLFAETRRRLADEITALESLSRPDVTGMAFTLASLQDNLGSLPLKRRVSAESGGAQAAPGAQGEPQASGWRAFLRDVWESIKGLVVIRRSEPDDAPLLKPDQRVFLRQNLYLKLESARLALLDRDARSFRSSLSTAREWLQRYYDAAAPEVGAMLERLKELGAGEIAREMPDISGSLEALRAAREQRRSRADGGDSTSGAS